MTANSQNSMSLPHESGTVFIMLFMQSNVAHLLLKILMEFLQTCSFTIHNSNFVLLEALFGKKSLIRSRACKTHLSLVFLYFLLTRNLHTQL